MLGGAATQHRLTEQSAPLVLLGKLYQRNEIALYASQINPAAWQRLEQPVLTTRLGIAMLIPHSSEYPPLQGAGYSRAREGQIISY